MESSSDKATRSILLSKSLHRQLSCQIFSSTSPDVLSHLNIYYRRWCLLTFKFRVKECQRQSFFMPCQHHMRTNSCTRLHRTVVGSHYLWQVSSPFIHVSGTIHTQHRYQSPILSLRRAIRLEMVRHRVSLGYFRTSHKLLRKLTYKSSSIIRLERYWA